MLGMENILESMYASFFQTINYIFSMLFIVIGVIILIFVIPLILHIMKKRKIKEENLSKHFDLFEDMKSREEVLKELEIVDKLKLIDTKFDRETFISWVKMTFVKVQKAMIDGDFKELKKMETNELYERHKTIYKKYSFNQKQKRIIDDINIDTVLLYEFQRINGKDVVYVFLNAFMLDYIKEGEKIVKGKDDEFVNKSYTLTFIRKIEKMKHKEKTTKAKIETINCPQCGAPLNVTSIGTCEYCGNYIKLDTFNWVLSDITLNK